ncbi:MAG: PEP-CTERM sorting domain-containing protein [Alphaproteobacteria bacterium]|nr:PEP-CTERM sorting domain-containing protein [Alphaproteobacteria bacterium]
MKIISFVKQGIIAILLSVITISTASATIIWDYSPDTTGANGGATWLNFSSGQNFAELVTFATGGTITGMDIYSNKDRDKINDSVTIKIFANNGGTPGALITSLTEIISIIDTTGASSVANVTRKFASLTNPYTYSAGSFWIGMSGIRNIGQMTLDTNFPGNSQIAHFIGSSFQGEVSLGDMAFRLHSVARNVPEPAPLALLGFGLLGIAVLRRRKA